MQSTVKLGVRAGALAGLLLVGLFFTDYGPATNLNTVAHWVALSGNAFSKVIGALLLIVLGALFGGFFGLVMRRQPTTLARFIVVGLLTGLLWWGVLVLLVSGLLWHIQQSPYGVLFWLITSLVYGLVLGSITGNMTREVQRAQYEGARA
jgi:uncharacterized protein YacL